MKQFSNLKRAFLPCLFVLLTLPRGGRCSPSRRTSGKRLSKTVPQGGGGPDRAVDHVRHPGADLDVRITASFDRTPVSQVLREVLDRTVQYSIKDKMIVIYKASATPPPPQPGRVRP